MPTRPALVPTLTCENIEKTYEFFTTVLGFGGDGKMPAPPEMGTGTMHAEVFLPAGTGETRFMLGPRRMAESTPESGEFGANLRRGGPLGQGVSFYAFVADVDKYHAFVRANGADVVQAPTDQFWGYRDFSVRTPDGYFLAFGSPIRGFRWPRAVKASVTGAAKPTAPVGRRKPTRVGGTTTRTKAAKPKKGARRRR